MSERSQIKINVIYNSIDIKVKNRQNDTMLKVHIITLGGKESRDCKGLKERFEVADNTLSRFRW